MMPLHTTEPRLGAIRGDETVRLVPCPACVSDDEACLCCAGLRRVPMPFGGDVPLVAGGQGATDADAEAEGNAVLVWAAVVALCGVLIAALELVSAWMGWA